VAVGPPAVVVVVAGFLVVVVVAFVVVGVVLVTVVDEVAEVAKVDEVAGLPEVGVSGLAPVPLVRPGASAIGSVAAPTTGLSVWTDVAPPASPKPKDWPSSLTSQ